MVARSANPIGMLQLGALASLLCFAPILVPLPWIALLVAMFGFSWFYNAIMPQFEALTLSHLRSAPEQYSGIRLWGSLGFIASVLAGGWLCEHFGYALVPALMFACLLAVVGYSTVNSYAAELEVEVKDQSAQKPASVGSASIFLGVAFLMQVAHGPYYVYFSLLLDRHGYTPSAAGLYWSLGVLSEIAMFLVAPKLLRRFGLSTLISWCVAIGGLRWILTGVYIDIWWLLVLLQLGHALTFGLFHACAMRSLAILYPGASAGHGQALLYGLGSGAGGVAGSLMAGAIWSHVSDRASFVAAGLVSLSALLLIPGLRLALQPRKNSPTIG